MYRTDLAIENIQIKREEGINVGEKDGVIMRKEEYGEGIKKTIVEIVNLKGEAIMGKKIGKYITIETDDITREDPSKEETLARALADTLKEMIHFHYYLKVLIVGLGNGQVTPDSLGPKTLKNIRVTRHLFHIYDCEGDEEMAQVSAIIPGVFGTTGIETAEQIEKIAKLVSPEVILIIDALAARDINRISTTIQINDTGISPGAGMGNMRKALDEETLGAKVIAVGVPTVIHTKNLIIDVMKDSKCKKEEIEKYINEKELEMIVTSTDIDLITEKYSKILGKGINITLHPGIYS